MSTPLSEISSQHVNSMPVEEDDPTFYDPPSSPFISHIDADQENVPPTTATSTPLKPAQIEEDVPQSAFKISSPLKLSTARNTPVKASPAKEPDEHTDATLGRSFEERNSPKKASPAKQPAPDRPDSALSTRGSPSKRSPIKPGSTEQLEVQPIDATPNTTPKKQLSPAKKQSFEFAKPGLRDNEGLTIATKLMEETRTESHESRMEVRSGSFEGVVDEPDFNVDATGIDDTCFSTFSEVPNLDMTKFAVMRGSPTRNTLFDQATPRGRVMMTPSTVRRSDDRTPSPTPRGKQSVPVGENDTTNLLLDFTEQIQAFSNASRRSPIRGRQSPTKSSTESNLLSYIQRQRSPAKGGSFVPSTPAEKRNVMNLLDFELPPPPTPRSVPTVTIRELESLKSSFQSQISSLTATLSGREAEVKSLTQAVSNAERRVGEAQESLREERSAREHAEAQMEDWKKKGEEVQELLKSVQQEMDRKDEENTTLLRRIEEAERRADEAEARALDADARAVEAESKVVDTTTMLEADPNASGRRYSETEVQAAIDEQVHAASKQLHEIYRAKHERKIQNLKQSYVKRAEEKTKDLREQIKKLEKQIEELQAAKDSTFSKVLPDNISSASASATSAEDKKKLEDQQASLNSLTAKLAGLDSELASLRTSHASLTSELETERVEKGELVAAAEQMLQLQMEMQEQNEVLRKSVVAPPPPQQQSAAMTSGIVRPSGLRGPGFGLGRSMSGGKSRMMSNIERMGARSAASNHGE